jgi:indole-3-glycerol phosphate synthase
MGGFLDQMSAGSRARVEAARGREPLPTLRARCAGLPPPPALRLEGRFDLIAELKLRSPALGALGRVEDGLVARVAAYAAGGAAAVSVLTEPERFDGSLAHLETAAAALAPLGVPAMRKDFLVDPYQLHEARAAGAGGALLIIRMLSRETLAEMLDCARELGLFVLLEAFDEDDLAVAADLVLGTASRRGRDPAGGTPRLAAALAEPRAALCSPVGPPRHLGRGAETALPFGRAGEVASGPPERASFSSRASEAGARPDPARAPGTRQVPLAGEAVSGSRPRREAQDAQAARVAGAEHARGQSPVGTVPVLVGVNCRDLQTLEVVPGRFATLAPHLPAGVPRVAESGLETEADVERTVRAGYDVALVGGALMRAGDPAEAVRAMLAAGRGAVA